MGAKTHSSCSDVRSDANDEDSVRITAIRAVEVLRTHNFEMKISGIDVEELKKIFDVYS